ncbi:MAG: N-methyl-L-tryptophan oxidase [Anaerolineae bacterium]|nr:N-methyl-L-tryptophan oxidase [Anaerolineae bacterium]
MRLTCGGHRVHSGGLAAILSRLNDHAGWGQVMDDVIVLGAGVMGSAAAYHLARAGQRVRVLEQYAVDHTLGSSVDASRIFRYAYDHPAYVALARAAYPLWQALQDETGAHLMQYTGALDFGRADMESLLAFRQTLTETGVAHDWLTPAEVAQRFPQFHLDDDMMGLYHAEAGYLAAATCVITLAQQAQQHGAVIQTGARVIDIQLGADSVTVRIESESFSAARLVLTAGSWTPQLLGALDLNLPLVPTRQQVLYFETQDLRQFEPERFPVYITHGDFWYYGLPSVDGSGLKTAVHNKLGAVNPDTMKRTVDAEHVEQVRAFVRRYLPLADGPLRSSRTCLYTMTPDEHFIVDRHPTAPQIVIGAGFSGHGFKFGILIGQILADLALTGSTPHDISLFQVTRFGA